MADITYDDPCQKWADRYKNALDQIGILKNALRERDAWKKVADDLAVSVQIKIRAHEIPCGCLSCKALNAYRQMEAK